MQVSSCFEVPFERTACLAAFLNQERISQCLLYCGCLQVAKAVSDAECQPTELAEVLAQVCYERQLCDLQQRGISFSRSSIILAPGQLGSSPAISIHHADNQHKGKRLLRYVRNQHKQQQQQQQQQQQLPKQLISREAVLAAGVPLVNSKTGSASSKRGSASSWCATGKQQDRQC